MVNQRLPPALKHAGYSALDVLPGEDRAAFEKLREGLIGELGPVGPSEKDVVVTIARLVWRKANIHTYRMATDASRRWTEIKSEQYASPKYPGLGATQEEEEAMLRADEKKAQRELGPAWDLVQMHELATTDYLLRELSIIDRIDGMIDRSYKRLLFIRGLKSISPSITARRHRKQ
jgi:hypothetical protein